MFSDIFIITYTWFLSLILVLISAPYLLVLCRSRLNDAGWGLARLSSWLALSLIIWFLAHARLPVNTTWFIYLLIASGVAASFWFAIRHKTIIRDVLLTRKALILSQESLFLFGLFTLSLIRAHNPAILDLEKFMDVGFMAVYLRAPVLPAPDMWLSGHTINYYSFGHFMGSVLTRFWQLPVSLSYNLLLGFIAGLGLSISFSVVTNLVAAAVPKIIRNRLLIVAGFLGAFFVVIGGNMHTAWFKLSRGSWDGYWYADATRFIENTIHEFPSYSFVVSDIHGHVWDFPIVLGFVLICLLWVRALFHAKHSLETFITASLLGLFLGVMTMTSMWDLMIYGLLLVISGLFLLAFKPKLFTPLALSAIIAFVTLALTVTPFFLHFDAISDGVALVTERSPLWQLLVLWSGHWIMSLAAISLALLSLIPLFRHRHSLMSQVKTKLHLNQPAPAGLIVIVGLVITAWLLLLLPEVIYVKDIYTGHPRANTMFKLTYQAFILMSLSGAWVFGYVWQKSPIHKVFPIIVTAIVVIVGIAALPFPYFSYRDYYGGLRTYKSLDGWQWLAEQYPEDYDAILWLNANLSGQPVVLESWGESYTTFNRVSAYTGLPTVIGWRVHEWLWRGGFDIAGERSGHVDIIYKNPTSTEALNLIEKYRVEYIFVGSKEKEAYPDSNLEAIRGLGETIYRSGETYIVKVGRSNASFME
jgi:uncharacterized membrane protein